jgi:hypothetical protein
MANYYIKRKDTWPAYKNIIEQTNPITGNKEPVNLTGAVKIRFLAKATQGATLIEGLMTGPGGGAFNSTGEVEYLWVTGDTNTVGEYQIEYEITWKLSPLQVETVPNNGYESLAILTDLGGS